MSELDDLFNGLLGEDNPVESVESVEPAVISLPPVVEDGQERFKAVNVPVDSVAYGIAQTLAGKLHEVEDLEARYASVLKRKDEVEKAKKALHEQLRVLVEESQQIDSDLMDYRREKRLLNAEIFNLRRSLNQALENEAKSKELIKNRLEFNKLIQKFAYHDQILEHQKDGAFILATNMRCILGDKRGAGKTLTAIASWDMAQSQKVLVIVPDDVVSNFINEIRYWAPHRQVIQMGKLTRVARSAMLEMAKMMESFVMVINYSAWRKDKSLLDDLVSLKFDTVVMDEAHEIKNTSTSAYQGCSKLVLSSNQCPKCHGDIKQHAQFSREWQCVTCDFDTVITKTEFGDMRSVKMVIPMSGTVILNKPQDLFALLSLVDPINFVEVKDFLRVYCTQNYWTSKWEFQKGGLVRLQERLSGKYIAREGVKTPGQKIYTHDIEIDKTEYPAQYKVIEQLSKHAQIVLSSGKQMNIMAVIALITRKRQANVWPAGIQLKDENENIVFSVADDVTESIKVDKCIGWTNGELSGLIPEVTEDGDMELGARVVVFSQFKGPLAELERRCKIAGISAVRFDGDTPQHIRDEAKIDFDRKYCDQPGYEKKWQVILCNYRTGGVGLNFTGATEMILMDREWNPGKEEQAMGRTDRLGQTQETNVHIIRLKGTVDVWLDNLIDEKKNLIEGFNAVAEPLSNQLLDAMRNGDIL